MFTRAGRSGTHPPCWMVRLSNTGAESSPGVSGAALPGARRKRDRVGGQGPRARRLGGRGRANDRKRCRRANTPGSSLGSASCCRLRPTVLEGGARAGGISSPRQVWGVGVLPPSLVRPVGSWNVAEDLMPGASQWKRGDSAIGRLWGPRPERASCPVSAYPIRTCS